MRTLAGCSLRSALNSHPGWRVFAPEVQVHCGVQRQGWELFRQQVSPMQQTEETLKSQPGKGICSPKAMNTFVNNLLVPWRSEVEVKLLSHVRLFATPWTVAYQASQSMEFSRQDYWSGLPFASPEDLHDPGIEPTSPALQADALLSEPPGKPKRRHTDGP